MTGQGGAAHGADDGGGGADVSPATGHGGAGGSAEGGNSSEDGVREEVWFPSGRFRMGSTYSNFGPGYLDHTPVHDVTLSPFWIDAFEVTVGQYRACVESGTCRALSTDPERGCTYTDDPGEGERVAVGCVHIDDAVTYCDWDGGRRLPTEAEWERAARGTESRSYPWGDSFDCTRAAAGAGTACVNRAIAGPVEVGSFPAGDTPEGIHDMAGNVAEWVSDIAAAYSSVAVVDPVGATSGASRILRGGQWSSTGPQTQAFARATSPGISEGPFGFRCARD